MCADIDIYVCVCLSHNIYIYGVNEIVRQCGEMFWVMLGGFHPNTCWGDVRLTPGLAGYFKNQFPTTHDTQMTRKVQGIQSHCN